MESVDRSSAGLGADVGRAVVSSVDADTVELGFTGVFVGCGRRAEGFACGEDDALARSSSR